MFTLKNISIVNPGLFFIRILRKNDFLCIALAVFLIGTAFLLILQYEKERNILKNKWDPCFERTRKGNFKITPVIKNQPIDWAQYNIKVSLKANLSNKPLRHLEIRFCDKYSLILADSQIPLGLYYYKTDNSAEKYIQTINYNNVIRSKNAASVRPKKINLSIECNLTGKTACIYINDKLIEKVYLDPGTRHYAVNLTIMSKDVILYKVEISDRSGAILFNANYGFLFVCKTIAQILVFFGVLIFFALACLEKSFLEKTLYLMIILFCLESFLRIGERYNQDFNIQRLTPRWDFARLTNLYGSYDNIKEVEIRNNYYRSLKPRVYAIPKPVSIKRIICMGTSPVAGAGLSSDEYTFSELLEKKLTQSESSKHEVIPSVIFGEVSLNNFEPYIFLKDVLLKLDPDLILFYLHWASFELKSSVAPQLGADVLYNRAKKIMEKNSAWITNDRTLYSSLEFKKPIKEIVYLYNFLCKSYLFMGLENIRKRIFNRLYYINQESLHDKPRFYFNEILKLCRERKTKMLLVVPFNFSDFHSIEWDKREIMRISRENPEVYYLDLEEAFRANKDFSLGYDATHPSEYGHEIIAEEILKKLRQMDFIDTTKTTIE